ncbi:MULTISPECIES: tripartite tricarboxylate transporter permease [unclassified Paenibacillus]|uniref:tripartite tricarboxylate transporter permease n=1 Tax=unclassified Paenibacillus TaxID=185978 RepID=UPI001AE5AC90|nr:MULTISPECIES: tripartite tricarboxylate transporter permease [unclassified Paenibacillus]MBP1154054.1 putative tricarboxylic transport membrane protein [Paenibacillus sp. PvP091]MBP1170561.1 putative tricarboxylic transport membrane protein [Paenibacillus sp. PvR098]MBP2441589.1 putative tricarboxylic transport membrane protein [Paenibacillus sp. PvP052]
MGFLSQIGNVFQWDLMLLMVGSVIYGLIIGILPGIGGPISMALLIPLTFSLSPEAAIVVLLSAYGSSNFGGSITSILINTPGDAVNAATTFDGYPLAKQGKAGMAITAAMFCSALGGFVGLVVLDLMLPFARDFILLFSYPDFFMLGLFGLAVIAVVTQGNTFRGFISALLGLMLAFIGTEPIMGGERFTFDSDYLWDGISLVPAIIGLFAVTEAFKLSREENTIAGEVKVKSGFTWEGITVVFKNFWLFLRSCFIGIYLGMIPGVGGTVASFMAYGTAVQMSKDKEKFGKGAIEGVIAVESANDAKEGGSLLPTLVFGIPGSASMAVLIGGLMMHGLTPGPEMLKKNLDLTYFLIAAAIVAKVVAMVLGLVIGTRLVFMTKIRCTLMAPAIIVISMLGAYGIEGRFGDVIVTVLFGLIGIFMQKYGYSRIALTIALVLGGMVEATYHQSMTTFGPSGFFTRPIAVTLLTLTIVSLVYPFISNKRKNRTERSIKS